MNKFFKKIANRISLMLAFGMKGGDDAITNQSTDNTNNSIIQKEETKNLGEALMKGEVTQQVEELRYKDYRVTREANNYAYIGDGKAIKKKVAARKSKYMFYQDNNHVCEGVGHEMDRIGEYRTDRYTFSFVYRDITKFKLEAYANYGRFSVNGKEIKVELFFDKSNKIPTDPVSYKVVQELEKISKFNSQYQIERCDICTNPAIMSFITYKANGEDDIIQYTIRNLSYENCVDNGISYILSFTSNDFDRVDLTDKFFSKSAFEKYEKKAPKVHDISFYQEERKEFCSICGKEMNVYDADITKYEFGKPICKECLEKYNLNS